MIRVYRVVCGDLGIYAAVERDCPPDDPRRAGKPDGSWLEKVGTRFPGAISFWTDEGIKKYRDTGLQHWHSAVVKSPVEILVARYPEDHLYADAWQVICYPDAVVLEERKPLCPRSF